MVDPQQDAETNASTGVGPAEEQLSTIARHARQTIREDRVIRTAFGSLDSAAFLLGVPALLQIIGIALFNVAFFSTVGLIVWTLLLPFAWIVFRAFHDLTDPIDEATAVATVDRALELEDRLIAAREFLALPDRGPFHQAAIDDATPAIERALTGGLERSKLVAPPLSVGARALGAILLVVVALFLVVTPGEDGGTPIAAGGDPVAPIADRASDSDPEGDTPPVEPRPRDEETPRPEEREKSGTEPGGARSGEQSEDVKKTIGETTSGKSSSAASASGASQSKGAPSNQSQASEAEREKSKRAQKKPKEGKPSKSEKTPPRKPEEMSGATAGRGAASGSSKSPSSSKWSSKDQVTSDDEEDLEEDEEVDDEFDNSDARGGLQPQLRDRKPPVNRDLSIGFGNGKNPDANGRGGPSEQKKSRGVASLVLGVPIPDHVKGRPNPGKTKITQERVEPQEEDAPSVAATDRTRRQGPDRTGSFMT